MSRLDQYLHGSQVDLEAEEALRDWVFSKLDPSVEAEMAPVDFPDVDDGLDHYEPCDALYEAMKYEVDPQERYLHPPGEAGTW